MFNECNGAVQGCAHGDLFAIERELKAVQADRKSVFATPAAYVSSKEKYDAAVSQVQTDFRAESESLRAEFLRGKALYASVQAGAPLNKVVLSTATYVAPNVALQKELFAGVGFVTSYGLQRAGQEAAKIPATSGGTGKVGEAVLGAPTTLILYNQYHALRNERMKKNPATYSFEALD